MLQLTAETFAAAVDAHPHLFVQFYAPWCHHCNAMEEDWLSLASLAASKAHQDLALTVARVDGVAHPSLSDRYIRGFPTLLLFLDGDAEGPLEYVYEREVDKLLRWASDRIAGIPLENYKPISTDFDESKVMVLTHDNFDSSLSSSSHSNLLINFCDPAQIACQNAYYQFALLAESPAVSSGQLILAKVDAFMHQELATRYGIEKYPTVMLFREGVDRGFRFVGEVSEVNLQRWFKYKLRPRSLVLETDEELAQFLSRSGSKVLYHASSEEQICTESWLTLAEQESVEAIDFAHMVGPTPPLGQVADSVAIFHEFEPVETFVVSEDVTPEEMLQWIELHAQAKVGRLSERTWMAAGSDGIPLAIIFLEQNDLTSRQLAFDYASKLPSSLRQEVTVLEAYVDDFEMIWDRWGISGRVLPTAILVRFTEEGLIERTVFNEAQEVFSQESFATFVRQALIGEYVGYRLSEPLPSVEEVAAEGLVKKLVLDNWDSVVGQGTVDVLVQFTIPFCGPCKAFAPNFLEAAALLEANSTIQFATMDMNLNADPLPLHRHSIAGYPSYVIIPKSSGDTVRVYAGDRTALDFVRFVRGEATSPPPFPLTLTGDDIPVATPETEHEDL